MNHSCPWNLPLTIMMALLASPEIQRLNTVILIITGLLWLLSRAGDQPLILRKLAALTFGAAISLGVVQIVSAFFPG